MTPTEAIVELRADYSEQVRSLHSRERGARGLACLIVIEQRLAELEEEKRRHDAAIEILMLGDG